MWGFSVFIDDVPHRRGRITIPTFRFAGLEVLRDRRVPVRENVTGGALVVHTLPPILPATKD